MASTFRPSRTDRAERAAFRALLAAPAAVRRRGAKPIVIDGNTLDPDLAVGLKVAQRLGEKGYEEMSVDQARVALARSSWIFGGEPEAVASVRTMRIPGAGGVIPARLYRPLRDGEGPEAPPLPLLVYFHGGGWVLGGLDTHDTVCRALTAGAEVAVLSVDYRLAPEHPFPAAVDDAVAAFDWAYDNAARFGLDQGRIAVGGDSAGGNLAAVVSQLTVSQGGPRPAFQLLIVPATDFVGTTRSATLFGEGFYLTQANLDWYEENYLGDSDRSDPRVSPLLAEDLTGQPPAYIAVAGFDPLRDEGIAYAEKLQAAGVPTTLRVHTDAIHAFINILQTDLGRRCMADAVAALREGLSVPPPQPLTGNHALEAVAANSYVSLTTFKKSGEPVASPVWIARRGNTLVFTTDDGSWKVKRIGRTPQVELRPCDMRGRVAEDAPIYRGTARILREESDHDAVWTLIRRKYKVAGAGIGVAMAARKLTRRAPAPRCAIEITLTD